MGVHAVSSSSIGSIWKKVSVVAGGAVGGQVLGVALLPIVARFVSPYEMGHYARAVAMGMTMSVVLTLRLEAALFTSSTPGRQLQTAFAAVSVAAILSCVAWLALSMPVAGEAISSSIGFGSRADIMLTVAVGFALATFTSLTNAAAAIKAYRAIATSKPVKQALEMLLLGTIAGMSLGAARLPWASVAACLVAAIVAGRGTFAALPKNLQHLRRPRLNGMLATIRRFRKFSMADLPSAFAVHASLALPLVFFSGRFGLAAGGIFALAQRVVNAPVALAGSSVGLVFRAELKRHRQPTHLFSAVFAGLLGVGAAIYALLAALPDAFLSWLLGAQWMGTGPYLAPMAVYGFVRMIAIPLSYALYVTEAVRLNAFMQLAHLVAIVLFFMAVDQSLASIELLRAFVALEACFYLAYLVVSYNAVRCMRSVTT